MIPRTQQAYDAYISETILARIEQVVSGKVLILPESCRSISIKDVEFTVERFDGVGITVEDAVEDLWGRLLELFSLNAVKPHSKIKPLIVVGVGPECVYGRETETRVCARLCLVYTEELRLGSTGTLAVDHNLESLPWK